MSTLRDLIRALDRRVPQVDRPGELRIARDAQMLRRQAVAQIDALSYLEPDDNPYDHDLVDAIMTDDGSPLNAVDSANAPICSTGRSSVQLPARFGRSIKS